MILKICSLKIGSESFSYKPKGILSTLFFHLSNKKKGSQKGFETFPFKQKIFFAFFKLLLLLLLLYTIFMISCLKAPCIVALFVWLFNFLFTRYWKISCTCLTFMDLDLLLYPPFPFYLFFYRNQLSFLWLHFCMTWCAIWYFLIQFQRLVIGVLFSIFYFFVRGWTFLWLWRYFGIFFFMDILCN